MLGYFNERWNVRQALAALKAKREDDWARFGLGLYWIVNSMPNFSSKRRQTIPLSRFNPFVKKRKQSDAARDAGFDAMWAIAEDAT